jgi:hypothetical protein
MEAHPPHTTNGMLTKPLAGLCEGVFLVYTLPICGHRGATMM